ncbi:MAG: NTPase [Promethearchaeota archaeon]
MLKKSNILLTGKPGSGKTTAIRKVVDQLNPNSTAGFWSREIREEGQRVGFAIETLSGRVGTLAHVNRKNGPKVSKYRVNITDIDSIVVPELKKARKSGRFIIIDEIAKMELFSNKFADEVRRCLDTKRVIGTIQDRKLPFLDEVRTRTDVTLLELTISNRNRIPMQVLRLLGT